MPRLPRITTKRTQFIYGDESGGFKNEPYFLLGIVQTYEPRLHDEAIEKLRDKHDYSRQFEYKKTDRLNSISAVECSTILLTATTWNTKDS